MKKILALIIISLVAVVGCSSSKSSHKQADTAITKMGYSASTRGSSKDVTITRDKVEVKEFRQGKNIEATYPLSKNNWNKLVALAQKVNLDKMETLEPPTKKHQHDGAMAASLRVTAGSTTYQSAAFDDGNPPAEIKALVEEIAGISGVGKIQVKE